MAGMTGKERSQTIAMIAELMWNADGSPAMDDVAYAGKYVVDAMDQFREYQAGRLDPWWWE